MLKKTKEQKEARFQVKERAYRDQIAKLQMLVEQQHQVLMWKENHLNAALAEIERLRIRLSLPPVANTVVS